MLAVFLDKVNGVPGRDLVAQFEFGWGEAARAVLPGHRRLALSTLVSAVIVWTYHPGIVGYEVAGYTLSPFFL